MHWWGNIFQIRGIYTTILYRHLLRARGTKAGELASANKRLQGTILQCPSTQMDGCTTRYATCNQQRARSFRQLGFYCYLYLLAFTGAGYNRSSRFFPKYDLLLELLNLQQEPPGIAFIRCVQPYSLYA